MKVSYEMWGPGAVGMTDQISGSQTAFWLLAVLSPLRMAQSTVANLLSIRLCVSLFSQLSAVLVSYNIQSSFAQTKFVAQHQGEW